MAEVAQSVPAESQAKHVVYCGGKSSLFFCLCYRFGNDVFKREDLIAN